MTYIEKPKWKAGQKVRATINCSGAIAGKIYELEDKPDNDYGTETQLKGTDCHCGYGWELVEDPRIKFKVGDRVECVEYSEGDGGAGWKKGWRFNIKEITASLSKESGEFILWGGYGDNGVYSNWVKLLPSEKPKEERPHFVLGSNPAVINTDKEKIFSYPNYQPRLFKRKESKMNSVIQSLQAKLKPTDKTLVKHGYLNSDGTRTSMYEDQLREMAMKKLIDAEDTKEFRAELASELKEYDK